MSVIRACVLGSINYDCVATVERLPVIGETILGTSFKTFVGGKGANQAVQLSLLGAEVAFFGKIGLDDIGETLRKGLVHKNIDIRHLYIDEKSHSGSCSIHVDRSGYNTIVYVPGSNTKICKQDIDDAMDIIASSDVFITQNEVNLDMVNYALKKAKDYGVTTILNPAPFTKLPVEIYQYIDYIIPNETEAACYSGISVRDDLQAAVNWFTEKGVKNVIITLGEDGAYFSNCNQAIAVPAFKVKAVDTTAAGDAFIGGFAFELMTFGGIKRALTFGNACGALAASREGAQASLADRVSVDEFLLTAKSN